MYQIPKSPRADQAPDFNARLSRLSLLTHFFTKRNLNSSDKNTRKPKRFNFKSLPYLIPTCAFMFCALSFFIIAAIIQIFPNSPITKLVLLGQHLLTNRGM